MIDDEDVFKRSAGPPDKFDEKVALLRKEITERNERLKEVAEKLKDPVYIAGMMMAVEHERENTNRILKNIYVELERVKGLEERVGKLEELATQAAMPELPQEAMLPEVDTQIREFVREKGMACAEDVRKRFGYRGKNAASARLNRLFEIGVLKKEQVGRKVLYSIRKES